MATEVFSAGNRTTVKWASGTSTEIFIFPPGASFAERNFLFRISTATVEAEESTFTFFEGITRHLMILEGKLELIHEGRYSKHMRPFDQDTFSGEWPTRSKGKVTDFNLMLKGGATGELIHRRIEAGESNVINAESDFCFIYLASGAASFRGDAKSSGVQNVTPGDLICFDRERGGILRVDADCNLIEIAVAVPAT